MRTHRIEERDGADWFVIGDCNGRSEVRDQLKMLRTLFPKSVFRVTDLRTKKIIPF